MKVTGGGEYPYRAAGRWWMRMLRMHVAGSTNYTDIILTAQSMLKRRPGTVELERILAALIRSPALGGG